MLSHFSVFCSESHAVTKRFRSLLNFFFTRIYLTQSTQLVTHDMGHRNLVQYFKAAFICHLFVLRTSLALISSIVVAPSGSVMVYFMLSAKIFLLPQCIPYRDYTW